MKNWGAFFKNQERCLRGGNGKDLRVDAISPKHNPDNKKKSAKIILEEAEKLFRKPAAAV